MKLKLLFITIILFSNVENNIYAQNWIVLDNDSISCISTSVLESSPSIYKVRFTIHKIKCDNTFQNDSIYQKLSFDKSNTLQNIGEPALPNIIQHIGLPSKSSYVTEIIENEWKDVTVGKIYPAQKPEVSTNVDSMFVICDSVYMCEKYDHPLLESSEIMTWKGIDNIYLTICPFRYHPSSNKLSVLSDFTLSVIFTNNVDKEMNMKDLKYEEKDLMAFNNYNFISTSKINPPMKNATTNDSCNYLIIVGNIPEIENSQSMKDYRKWKALKGYKSKLVSTSVIGSDTTSIKNYIIQQNAAGIKQVLFVGDNEKIPLAILPPYHHQTQNEVRKSDYWYGCLDGCNDLQAEIPIGRFLTNNLESFSNIVNKTIKYESLPHEWTRRNLLVAHSQINYFQTVLENISNTTFDHPINFYKAYGAPISLGGLGSDKYDVIDYINYGMNIVTINCHGNTAGFWMFDGPTSTFSYEDRFLLNDNTYPIYFSNACYNGDFTDYIHSIAAYFSCSNHSSTAYLGTTMPSYIDPANDYLEYLYSNLLDQGNCNLGDLVVQSHVMNLGFGATAKDNAFNYICGGDPTLEIWTEEQQFFDNIDINVHVDSLSIIIYNIDSFKVNVVSDYGFLLNKYVSNGSCLSIAKPLVNCDIAIDKHNFIPYIIHFNVDDYYIQNITFDETTYYANSPLSMGYDVNMAQPYGNVTIEPGAKLMINKGAGMIIKNGFECKQGGELLIK